MAQRSLRGLGAPALAPCHLAKQKDPDTHSNWSPQEANSVPILPQSASRHDAGGRNPHSNHLCRSTVRFGSKNRLQRSRKRGPRDAGALRVSFSLILGLEGAQPKFTLFRMPYVNGLRHEHGALRGSLRGGATELELDLIKLIDDLAHDCLIRVGRSSQRSLRLWGGSDRRNCRRCRDENRWRRP